MRKKAIDTLQLSYGFWKENGNRWKPCFVAVLDVILLVLKKKTGALIAMQLFLFVL